MPVSGQLTPLAPVRYKQHHSIPVGDDLVIDWEAIPKHTEGPTIMKSFKVFTKSTIVDTQCCVYDLACWWLPAYDADEAEMFDTVADIEDLYRKRVRMVQDTAPATSWTFSDTGDEANQGGIDESLVFQPGLISLKALTDATQTFRLFHRREYLGFLEGKAYRYADGIRGAATIDVRINGGQIVTSHPGYLVWVLTNPAQPANFNFAATMPPNNDWAELDFLAPSIDPATGFAVGGGADVDDIRRYLTSYYFSNSAAAGGDPVQMKQAELCCRIMRNHFQRRPIRSQGIIDPEA